MLALIAIVLVGVLCATLPAVLLVLPASGHPERLDRLLPPALVAVVLVGVGAAAAGGGGREVIGRDAAAVHPVDPIADSLGALALAPLSAGWLIQAWALLGLVAAVGGIGPQPVAVAWLLAATTLAQVAGWAAEWLRRRSRGLVVVRLALPLVVAGAVVWPARVVAGVIRTGNPPAVAGLAALLCALALGLAVLGGRLAVATSRLVPRDEGRLERRTHAARPAPRSDLALLRRVDRASVWRSVPLRRGTWLLAVAPGVVALAGGLSWPTLVMMPGLVASGCLLLFGVNLWCLDGRGLLWRETLPVTPTAVLAARAWVLTELLLGAGGVTLLLGALRAGRPTTPELLAVVLALVTVVAQALSAGLRWSAAHPHAVDLRSARATPAPPLAMVGYSLRLALATTVTGLLLAGLAGAGRTDLALAVAAIPAAVEAVIHAANAHRVRAAVVVEGANGPTTPAADDVLARRGTLVVPDILANAGGVVVSYFEWVQANQAYWWSEDDVNQRLAERMQQAWESVLCTADRRGTSLRNAATLLAVERVANAHLARGLYP